MAVVRSRSAVPAHDFLSAYFGLILPATAMGRQTFSVVFLGLAYLEGLGRLRSHIVAASLKLPTAVLGASNEPHAQTARPLAGFN